MTREWDGEGYLFLQSVYDDRDRVIEQIDASGTHSYFAYDASARVTTFTDNAGNHEVYHWDELNRVTQEEDASGNAVHQTEILGLAGFTNLHSAGTGLPNGGTGLTPVYRNYGTEGNRGKTFNPARETEFPFPFGRPGF